MSQDNYDMLINRILMHCRQVARDMKPPRFGWTQQEGEWVQTEEQLCLSFLEIWDTGINLQRLDGH